MMAVRLPPGSLRPYLIVTAIYMLQAMIKYYCPSGKVISSQSGAGST